MKGQLNARLPGLRATRRLGTGGGAGPTKLAVGATFGGIGDGLASASGGVGPGSANVLHAFERLASPWLQPVAAPVLCRSGSTMFRTSGSNYAWINPYAADALALQWPNVYLFTSCIANDNVWSTNPVGSVPLQDWKGAVTYCYGKFAAYAGPSDVFLVEIGVASTKLNESTYRAAVQAEQIAHVNSLGDPRVVLADTSVLLPPESYSAESGGFYVHGDERGASARATIMWNLVKDRIESKTLDQVTDMIYAGTYPLMAAAQGDTDRDLAGTGGTLTNVSDGGGGIAASKLITNTTGSVSISAAMQAVSGSRRKIVVTLGGTASSAGKVMIGDKNNLSLAAKPGQYVRTGARMKAPSGFHNWGVDWNGALYGIGGAGANSIANNAMVGAGEASGFDALLFANELNLWGNSTTFTGRRNLALFFRSGTTLSGTIEVSDFFHYLVDERSRVPAAYLGALVNGNGALFFSSANQHVRASGTISQAAGGTIRVDPGLWVPRGLTEADFVARRLYKGTAADTAIGSGTQIGATMSGAAWISEVGAGVVAPGDRIFPEVDVICPLTSRVITIRGSAADAMMATS